MIKKIQNTCIILCLFLLSFEVKSQYAIAGIQGFVYVDIVPDTLIEAHNPYQGGPEDVYYYIDINQDGIKDIRVNSHNAESPGGMWQGLNLLSLDTFNTRFSVNRAFNLNDTINKTAATYTTSGSLYYFSQTINGYSTQSNLPWGDSINQYIGVKYQNPTDTLYGWVRVRASAYSLLIKEYSLGVSSLGIGQPFLNSNALNIYPNPANTNLQITISGKQAVNISIHDMLGKQVISTTEKNIDISNLQEGIYFVTVKTAEGIATKKIMIQR